MPKGSSAGYGSSIGTGIYNGGMNNGGGVKGGYNPLASPGAANQRYNNMANYSARSGGSSGPLPNNSSYQNLCSIVLQSGDGLYACMGPTGKPMGIMTEQGMLLYIPNGYMGNMGKQGKQNTMYNGKPQSPDISNLADDSRPLYGPNGGKNLNAQDMGYVPKADYPGIHWDNDRFVGDINRGYGYGPNMNGDATGLPPYLRGEFGSDLGKGKSPVAKRYEEQRMAELSQTRRNASNTNRSQGLVAPNKSLGQLVQSEPVWN